VHALRKAIAGILALGLAMACLFVAYDCIDQLSELRRGMHGNWTNNAAYPRPVASYDGRLEANVNGETTGVRLVVGNALVLISDGSCRICNYNMPRWLDLIAKLRSSRLSPDIYVVAVDSSERAATKYWKGLEDVVKIVRPADVSTLGQSLPYNGTPTTISVRDGRIHSVFVGILGFRRQSRILRELTK